VVYRFKSQKFANFTTLKKLVKILKDSFPHISIKHKTITFLLHTKTYDHNLAVFRKTYDEHIKRLQNAEKGFAN